VLQESGLGEGARLGAPLAARLGQVVGSALAAALGVGPAGVGVAAAQRAVACWL